jgi:uncharacterized protein YcbK (DUF882 family)
VPIRHARKITMISSSSRVGRCCGLAAIVVLLGNTGLQNAVADGDTRTLTFRHTHRDDDLTVTFKRNGRYDDEALKKLNYFLRDWRTDAQTKMDARLFDVLWEVYREVGAKEPINIVSSYRSPATNAMLRRRGRGVAQFSQHMLGKAMDFYIPGVALEDLRIAGLRQQRGGVGYYPTSGSPFVHVDVGNIRHWPRMTHDQLARVFPNGRTVHVPSDGQPLSGYALALADVEKRGSSPSQTSLDAARGAGVQVASAEQSRKPRNFLAALLGIKEDEEDGEGEGAASTASAPPPAVRHKTVVAAVQPKAPTPLPAARPATVVASATPVRPDRLADAASLVLAASPSANEVIATRGFWPTAPDAVTEGPKTSRAEPTTAAPTITASLPQWPAGSRTDDPAASAHKNDVPGGVTLAYAAHAEGQPDAHASSPTVPIGAAGMRTAATTASLAPVGLTTVIKKTLAPLQAGRQPVGPAVLTVAAKVGDRTDDPWMRAVVMTPDVQNFLTTTVFGMADARQFASLMQKPSSAVMMTFADDPNSGMVPEQFSGSAVTFQSTVTFNNRTALLQLQ